MGYLEENIEFIDWSLVPFEDITPTITDKFRTSFPELKCRLFLENILSKMKPKIDSKVYPDNIFFFIDDEYYMDLHKKTGNVWCSNERIWKVFEKEYSNIYDEIWLFIKNVVEQYFINIQVTPQPYTWNNIPDLEQHFKNIKPLILDYPGISIVEDHFKFKE